MNVDFERACSILREGHALVFPTDTVVGLGVAVCHAAGPRAVFAAKRRPADKPLAWLVDERSALDAWGRRVPAYAHALAEAFWPGAVTLIVPCRPFEGTLAPLAPFAPRTATLGLRMPASPLAVDLVRATGSPLATTSANFSGAPAPATLATLDPAFVHDLPVLAEGAPPLATTGVASSAAMPPASTAPPTAPSAAASTVVDCTGSLPRVLRAGTITASDIEEVLAHAGQHCE